MPWGAPVSEEPGRDRVIAGRYRLLSPLGEGGMGTVWRARDEVLHREVAVKEVRAPAGLPASDVERMYARLEREAWAAARVANRNVVTVYDVAMEGGRPWIVMELVRGLSLADELEAEGPLSPQRAAHIGAEVLAALRAAHAVGVLHRDVKPANVLLAADGRVVLTDFGIATVEGSSALTMTGEVVGSPEFLSPERALGRTPGPESDLWSLGVLLYAAVEGNSPFRYDTPLSTLRAVVDEELPPPHRAGPLAPVIEGLLRKDPAERLSAERAEQDLRIVAAGGAVRTEAMPVSPYAPTVAARPQRPSPTPPMPVPTGYPEPRTTAVAAPERNRRAGVVLVAGLLAVVLAVAGLTYALLNRDNGSGKGNAGAHTGAASGSAHSPTPSTGTDSDTGAPPPAHSSSTASSQPAQSVRVTLTGSHTEYDGTCPPPTAQAPAFTATFTVGRLPAQVEYRWVLAHGSVSDPGWKTLAFPAGGGRTKQVQVVVTAYSDGGTIENEISVEVRGPVRATSDSVPFSVTCATAATETPSGGASPSPSAS
ncbi:protein kinase [Streptomyces cellostaticus]|uniref:non-specific serine/threonine protein kinase n=1 Tax=Streptomyces cellostaticus TaxID=67285 RepID=A0A101NES3_9ACTN|nr:serine/threonine-protein kinase [Streptomyces cellostaticus]KUM91789.1 protein kinase [Streptomyces cellostaticus]GHI08845.1 protein kinase [Streptomyces cellostaticus]